jgi:hypothetical protein
LAAAIADGPAAPATDEVPDSADPDTDDPAPPAGDLPPEADVVELLTRADELFDEANAELEEGNLGAYQDKIQEAQRLVERALSSQDPTIPTDPTAPEETTEGDDGTSA